MGLSRFKFAAFAIFLGAAAWALSSVPASAQSKCKDLANAKCASSAECGWVSGYKTKTGKSVSAYCRAAPSKGASAGARSKAAAKGTAGMAKGAAKKNAKAATDKARSAERRGKKY